jgi:hypothetical protein
MLYRIVEALFCLGRLTSNPVNLLALTRLQEAGLAASSLTFAMPQEARAFS